ITPVEAELGRFVDMTRPFLGRDAVQERLEVGRDKLDWLLVFCEVGDGDGVADNDSRGNEPVYADGEIIGLTTSGAYGHSVGASLAFAYVAPAHAHPGAAFEIQLQGERRPATVLAQAAYDPENERIRS
ncbi:MAG: aminomethyltransferase, partial [Acidimicrobiia bacterium]|nr:aminomethyltransferase [Acidimicrobiia bacterium]